MDPTRQATAPRFVICHLSSVIAASLRRVVVALFALFASAPLLGGCTPSATPDPAASAAAQTEMKAFEPFLREPLCEQIAVKYQLATDYAAVGNADKTIELAQEVARAEQGFDFPLDGAFKLLGNCPDFLRIADDVQSSLIPIQTPRRLFYPNGIALSADDKTVFIADAFGVLVLDRHDASVRPLQPGPNMTLSGFDGLYTWKDCLVGVQNSMGSPRVVVVHLDTDRIKAIELNVLEYRTEFTQLPTTGAVVGDSFYYITNSQIDHCQRGKVLHAETLAPIVVAKVELQ
jgi:hypothetical protein